MRVAAIRSDLSRIYLSDVENRSQRNFSSEPAGQSRYFEVPTDAEFVSGSLRYAVISVRGSNSSASVDTDPNDTLRIKTSASGSFHIITVTSGNTTAKTVIRDDLNAAFIDAGLGLFATVVSNRIQIDSLIGGPTAYIEVDTVGNGSTLNTAIGLADGATSGLSISDLKTAIYPTSSTVDVSSTTILALSTFSLLSTDKQDRLVDATADLVAPTLVETGLTLLSFAYGVLSKLRSVDFQPGGDRIGLPTGPAVACVEDDGSTPFSL